MFIYLVINKNVLKKNIFGQTIFLKRLIIGFVGLITHRTFRSKKFEIKGSKNLFNLPDTNVLFVSNHQTYFYDVIAMLHVFNSSVKGRIDSVKSYLLKYKPDILMMQEIKTEDVNFPYDDFSSMDYESHVFGQKSYNGVAIISKNKLKNVKTDLIKDKLKQSRIISAEFEHKKKNIQLINIYTPNGNPVDTEKYDYKKNWLKRNTNIDFD